MNREKLALKIWNSRLPLSALCNWYGLTRQEVRDLADLGCELQRARIREAEKVNNIQF